jgi:two-component system, cell cycle sensor histidine kinase and response regulator CckA
MDRLQRFSILCAAAFVVFAVIFGVSITHTYGGSVTNLQIWAVLLGGFAALYALLFVIVWKSRIFAEQRDLSLQLVSLMNNVPGVVYRGLPNWTIPFMGANIENIVGHSSEEFRRKPWHAIVHPEDQGMLKQRVLEAVRVRERVLRLEYRLLHRDGSVRWVADRRQMIYGDDGWLRWVDGLILDITERKRSDVALRLTQFTVDRGSEATYWMGPDGRLIYVNDRVCEALGYSREELLSMKIQEINPEFPPERWPYHWDELRKRRIYLAESTHRAKDGHLIPVEITANYIEFDGKEYNCVYARDITARKRVEELILLERDFSKAVLDSLPGIFYLFNRKGKFLRWNTNLEEITGYSAEEIGKMDPLDMFAGPDKALVQERITDTFAKGTSEVEAELVTKSGKKVTYYFTGHTFQEKEEPCLIGTGIDISERKKLEEQLRQSQKMEAMGLLAGGIAHDFNNLLTGILGYANLLSLKGGVDPEVVKAAGIIQRSAERASQLTAQLLGFAEKGKNLNVPVELGPVIASVTDVLERTQDPRIRIVTSLHPEGGCVLGDPAQLDQVIMNLAINACDAMPVGGQLKITTEPVMLDEVFCREREWMSPGKYLLLSVADTGVGISPENLERIFDPFFTTKAQGKGTGLGLSMVFGIVKNHDGCVDVRSEAGAGTVFRVYLPESLEGAPTEKEEMDRILPRGRGRILLVDDQEPVREVAKDMLEALGYEVITAADGLEGISLYRDLWREIDLVILDMIMPNMSGGDCFRRMKEINPKARVVLSSGYSMDGAIQDVMNEGILAFIQKPYRLEELSRVLGTAVRTYQ